MAFDSKKHDIGFTKTNGETIGLMLAKDKAGVPQYQVLDDEYLANQLFTGVAGYGALPPEKELAIRQDDWRSGFGLEVYDANDEKRYFSSKNTDGRFRGMLIAGPKAEAVTVYSPTKPTIANHSFETWSAGAPVSWAHTTGGTTSTVEEETGEVKDGSKATKLVFVYNAGGAIYGTLTQTETLPNPTDYIGHALTFTAWVYQASNFSTITSTLKILRNDAQVDTDATTTKGSWVKLTVTYTPTTGTTSLKIHLHSILAASQEGTEASAIWDLVEDSIVHATLGTVYAMADFNSRLYFGTTTGIFRLNDAGTELLPRKVDFGKTITDLEPHTDDNLYIAIGKADKYWYMDTDEAFTESTKGEADFFQRVGVAFWKAEKPRELKSAVGNDPSNAGSWSEATNVDTSSYDITGLTSDGSSLFIHKEDRDFYLDGDGAVQILVQDRKPLLATTSGANSIIWGKKIYIPCGSASLIEYDIIAGTSAWRDPSLWCNNLSAFDGRVQGLGADERWLHAIIDNGDYVEVLAGRSETINGTTSWVWHPIAQVTLEGCRTAGVSSVVNKRLWIASTKANEGPYYIKLYANYGDVTNDANKNFQTLGEFITPWLHGNFKGDSKGFIKLILTMEDTTAESVYFRAYYEKLGDAAWREINPTPTFFQTSPVTTGYIPVDASGNNPVSTMIRFKFVPVCSTSATPKLLGYDCRAILYPTNRRIIACVAKCADDIKLKDDTTDTVTASEIKTAIEGARGATWPVAFYDIDYETSQTVKYVKFLPTQPLSTVTKKERDRSFERHFNLLLQEVTLS